MLQEVSDIYAYNIEPASHIQEISRIPQVPEINHIQLLPEGSSGLSRARDLLAKIDRIKINQTVARNGITHYVLNVYLYHPDCRIPTNLRQSVLRRTRNQRPRSTVPDYQVERRYSDFRAFRKGLRSCGCRGGLFAAPMCKFCIVVADYMERELHQPRKLMNWCTPTQYKKAMLTWYINNFIAFAQLHFSHVRPCKGTQGLLQLLEILLNPDSATTPQATVQRNLVSSQQNATTRQSTQTETINGIESFSVRRAWRNNVQSILNAASG